MFGLSTFKLAGIALIFTALISGGTYLKGLSDGKSTGALAALKAENDQLIERDKTDAEVEKLDLYELCVDLLGGVPDCDEFKD